MARSRNHFSVETQQLILCVLLMSYISLPTV